MLPAIALDAVVVTVWSVLVALGGSRLPMSALATDGPITRTRSWERDGRAYERFGIRRWKDRLPDAGAVFAGGRKRHLPGMARDGLARFAVETRRAELVHWVTAAVVVTFPLWNPLPLALLAGVLWVGANLPFIAVQRYNRARVEGILRTGRSSPTYR